MGGSGVAHTSLSEHFHIKHLGQKIRMTHSNYQLDVQNLSNHEKKRPLQVPLAMAKRRSLETPELPILRWRTSEEPLSKVAFSNLGKNSSLSHLYDVSPPRLPIELPKPCDCGEVMEVL